MGFGDLRTLIVKFFYAESVPEMSVLLTLVSTHVLSRAASNAGVYYYVTLASPMERVTYNHLEHLDDKPCYKFARFRDATSELEMKEMRELLNKAPLPAALLKGTSPEKVHELIMSELQKNTMIPVPKAQPPDKGSSSASSSAKSGPSTTGTSSSSEGSPKRKFSVPLSPRTFPANKLMKLADKAVSNNQQA